MEAAVHWIDRSVSSVDRDFDVFSYRVAAAIPFATSLVNFQEAFRTFANFSDFLKDARLGRLTDIQRLLPQSMTPEIAVAIEEMTKSQSDVQPLEPLQPPEPPKRGLPKTKAQPKAGNQRKSQGEQGAGVKETEERRRLKVKLRTSTLD